MGLRAEDPTRDVKAIRSSSKGYHSWTEDEIAQFETQHLVGSRARLALALLLYTGQRRSDVVRMGRQHVRDGMLQVIQDKGGAELQVPLLPALADTIAATADHIAATADHLTFLVTEFGRPFTAAGFGNWFRDRCNEAGLRHCSAHGLRKAAARRLAEAGCTVHQIAAITGHASLREIARYTKAVDQKRLAVEAMDKVKKMRTSTGKPVERLAKKEKNQ
jgi:integrase